MRGFQRQGDAAAGQLCISDPLDLDLNLSPSKEGKTALLIANDPAVYMDLRARVSALQPGSGGGVSQPLLVVDTRPFVLPARCGKEGRCHDPLTLSGENPWLV